MGTLIQKKLIRLSGISSMTTKESELAIRIKEDDAKLASNQQTDGNKQNEVDPLSRRKEQTGTGIQQEDAKNITREIQSASPTTKGTQKSTRQLKKEQDWRFRLGWPLFLQLCNNHNRLIVSK